jgi:NADH-quinone oxidoreductase subunit E
MNLQRVNEIIDSYDADRTATLAILQDLQSEYKYLPREALLQTADRLHVPLGEVYRMATFFRAFSLEPKGEYIVKVCMGTACHVRGSIMVLEQLQRDLGACALGPVVVVNEEIHGEMTPDKAHELIAKMRTD